MGEPARNLATFEALLALGEDVRAEILGGEIVEKAIPTGEHCDSQSAIAALLKGPFQWGRDGGTAWWIYTEPDIELTPHDVVRPDLGGWRRDRHPLRPVGFPIRSRPDWIAEILSASNASNDTVKKLNLFHRTGVPHYWLVDPERETLTVLRWSEAGYVTALAAGRGDVVRAEPFEAIEIPVSRLFGD